MSGPFCLMHPTKPCSIFKTQESLPAPPCLPPLPLCALIILWASLHGHLTSHDSVVTRMCACLPHQPGTETWQRSMCERRKSESRARHPRPRVAAREMKRRAEEWVPMLTALDIDSALLLAVFSEQSGHTNTSN